MDSSGSAHPGSPAAKIATPPTGVNPSDGVEHPPRRRRRCPPRGSESTSGRMSVTNSETVEADDMECSDGEAIGTDDDEEVRAVSKRAVVLKKFYKLIFSF
jgi:hypothetical protein